MPSIVVDLDGVLWRAERPIEGAAGAVADLRDAGFTPLFVTNNSYVTVADLTAKLERCGVSAAPDEVVTSAQAAASLLEPGSTALVVGGPGIVEALGQQGVEPRWEGLADAVVVGYDPSFDYAKLAGAMAAVRDGAAFVATNEDATYPVEGGEIPGGGALVAAVAYATGLAPVVAGKPHEPCARLVVGRAGPPAWVVGDRPSTDGRFAAALGARFGLVLSGVALDPGAAERSAADAVAGDLAALVPVLLAGGDQ